jgi:hypothetical protein
MAEGLGDGDGAASADDGSAAELWAGADDTGGAAAAWWPPPSVTASTRPVPVRARTAANRATPDRKLISSIRAFTTRLSLAAQPVPSLTTKHDTWIATVFVGGR